MCMITYETYFLNELRGVPNFERCLPENEEKQI